MAHDSDNEDGDDRETVPRRVRFPCGFTVKTQVPKGRYGPGDEIDREFSTKLCMSHRRYCTNPDGHAEKQRLGTAGAPHVEMTCTGKIVLDPKQDMRIRWAINRAESQWGDEVMDVYFVEEGVFRAVDEEYETIGFVLAEGAPEEYILERDEPWVFLRE